MIGFGVGGVNESDGFVLGGHGRENGSQVGEGGEEDSERVEGAMEQFVCSQRRILKLPGITREKHNFDDVLDVSLVLHFERTTLKWVKLRSTSDAGLEGSGLGRRVSL